ncbi:MAG: helix-turn-helix transcriptional regulator [Lachnospiraceae bacterium]|nr:helix-turn-helix transcriptional regulator [Lachnospiraceae bacterium]
MPVWIRYRQRKAVREVDIGSKIKDARIAAKLTQEQAAEVLGVSRQTISNWENGKTYPDIVSVVKMSDLYDISLDHLLKEKKETEELPVSDYVTYLDESTNAVKSRKQQSLIILAVVYLVIWAFSLIVFWFFTSGSDGMAYSLMFLWILLPVTTFVISLLIGKNGYPGRGKWILPIAFGIMYMLAEYGTFQMSNMIAFDKINMPAWGMIPAGAVMSAIGMGIGAGIRRIRGRAKERSEKN